MHYVLNTRHIISLLTIYESESHKHSLKIKGGKLTNTIKKGNTSAYYPFRYLVKWQNIKMKFGEDIRDKLDAICTAIEGDGIFLVEHHISASFDGIYFNVQSGPTLSPLKVLNTVKLNLYNVIKDKYPQYRIDYLDDVFTLVNWDDKSAMNYVPYYMRTDIKYSKDILNKSVGNKFVIDILKEGIESAVKSYNEKHDYPIEIRYINFMSHSVELVAICPLDMSASKMSKQIKGASSSYIGKNYKQYFKDRNSPLFISESNFWSGGKFYALYSKPIKVLTNIDIPAYGKLLEMWYNTKNENDPNKKGKLLEQFTEKMFELMDDFEILRDKNGEYDIKLGFEQIDLTLINSAHDLSSWGKYIKVECKNYAKAIGNDLIRDFSGKLRGNIRLGIMISANGFGKESDKLLIRLLANDDKLIVRISGDDIDRWFARIFKNFEIGGETDGKSGGIEHIFKEKIKRAEFELM